MGSRSSPQWPSGQRPQSVHTDVVFRTGSIDALISNIPKEVLYQVLIKFGKKIGNPFMGVKERKIADCTG